MTAPHSTTHVAAGRGDARGCSNDALLVQSLCDLSGLTVAMLLLSAILARNVGPAEKGDDRVIAVSEHRKARTNT
jgi:hypothetical protein